MKRGLRIAIVGCGNPNRSDDGAGIAVARILRNRGVDDVDRGVRVFDAGTDGMAVMFAARGCASLVVVDACVSGAAPGTVFEVPGERLAREPAASHNLHSFRWDDALAAGKKLYGAAFPGDVRVFLIEARSTDLGLVLSTEVAAAAAAVAERVERWARATPRDAAAP